MKSPQVFKNGKIGFSIIELVVVLGIMTLILGFGLFLDFDFLSGYRFLSEEKVFLSLLKVSRSRALNNINNTPHGLFIDDENFILFEGYSLEENPESHEFFFKNKTILIEEKDSTSFSVVFENLTALVSEERRIKIYDGKRESVVIINSEAGIENDAI